MLAVRQNDARRIEHSDRNEIARLLSKQRFERGLFLLPEESKSAADTLIE